MLAYVKNFPYKTSLLIYGTLYSLILGLVLQELQWLQKDDWFPRFGAFLVCFSLTCVFINHYLGELLKTEENNALAFNKLEKNKNLYAGRLANQIYETEAKKLIAPIQEKLDKQFGGEIDLMNVPVNATGKTLVETMRAQIPREKQNELETSIERSINTAKQEAVKKPKHTKKDIKLLINYEFIAAISGTFIWAFGDFKLIQILSILVMFLICIASMIPRYSHWFED